MTSRNADAEIKPSTPVPSSPSPDSDLFAVYVKLTERHRDDVADRKIDALAGEINVTNLLVTLTARDPTFCESTSMPAPRSMRIGTAGAVDRALDANRPIVEGKGDRFERARRCGQRPRERGSRNGRRAQPASNHISLLSSCSRIGALRLVLVKKLLQLAELRPERPAHALSRIDRRRRLGNRNLKPVIVSPGSLARRRRAARCLGFRCNRTGR